MDHIDRIFITATLSFIAVSTGILLFSANKESETFNRLTGAHTTWSDALWVELRVENPSK